MADAAAAAKQSSDFVAQLEAANLHPLWDRFRTLTPVKPQAKDPPLLWRWKDIEPFTERAVSEVAIDDVERRALILVNPAFGGETVTTSNLIAAFTVLDPGDRARPHRHTFAAIRFATRAEGAATIVDGGSVLVRAPHDATQRIAFLSMVENLQVDPGSAAARVIINSRTGTVVISSNVTVSPAAVSHGSLSVTIKEEQSVSQPAPFAKVGETKAYSVPNGGSMKVTLVSAEPYHS